jgi:hypothetical protein
MFKKVSILQELPPVGQFVTTIDKDGQHRVYRMNGDKTWCMRDLDGRESPNNNLPITHWLKEGIDRDTFFKIAILNQEIDLTKEKKQKLFGLQSQVIEILKGHTEIPQEEILDLFNQLEKLSKYLDAHIKKQFDNVGG